MLPFAQVDTVGLPLTNPVSFPRPFSTNRLSPTPRNNYLILQCANTKLLVISIGVAGISMVDILQARPWTAVPTIVKRAVPINTSLQAIVDVQKW